MGSVRKRARMRNLMVHPYCHWCEIKVYQYQGLEGAGCRLPRNMATIDHVFQKGDPRRTPGHKTPSVLACRRCNERRGRENIYRKGSRCTRK